ncbi:hypothetical protein [uncultured Friedmanniella sp.]|uniref:hypothetical protein n=1 Tax=uncultured Friedmanniella sp. TaxID=335381 RepID=UPI0035CBA554
MTDDPRTANPSAHLYGPRGRIGGVAGVLVGTDVAAFSPWPLALGYRTAFAVRVVAADGSADEWTTPVEVVYLRLEGAPERTNVAGVRLATGSRFPVVLGARVPDDAIVEALADTDRGSRGALLSLGPDRFHGLAHRSRLAPAVARPMRGAGRPPAAVPASFAVTTGPPRSAQLSLCRIFRWD